MEPNNVQPEPKIDAALKQASAKTLNACAPPARAIARLTQLRRKYLGDIICLIIAVLLLGVAVYSVNSFKWGYLSARHYNPDKITLQADSPEVNKFVITAEKSFNVPKQTYDGSIDNRSGIVVNVILKKQFENKISLRQFDIDDCDPSEPAETSISYADKDNQWGNAIMQSYWSMYDTEELNGRKITIAYGEGFGPNDVIEATIKVEQPYIMVQAQYSAYWWIAVIVSCLLSITVVFYLGLIVMSIRHKRKTK